MAKAPETRRDWLAIAGFVISALAFSVSVYAVYRSDQDSYLSHKANLAPVSWDIAGGGKQLQFHILNVGATPAHLIQAYGQVFDGGQVITSPDLLNNLDVMPSMSDKYVPILIWDIDPSQLAARKNIFVLILKYQDYEKRRETVSKFEAMQNPDGSGIHLQLIAQTLY